MEAKNLSYFEKKAVESLILTSKLYKEMHSYLPSKDANSLNAKLSSKIYSEYKGASEAPNTTATTIETKNKKRKNENKATIEDDEDQKEINEAIKIAAEPKKQETNLGENKEGILTKYDEKKAKELKEKRSENALIPVPKKNKLGSNAERPEWHAPWKLMRVISGHTGTVRTITIDSSNEWFATGGSDRTIKIWDLASGTLKLTLTGHISTIRGLCVSARHPYLFSAGEDKMIKCWDLEHNKVVRHYHGHLSGVYCLALHPSLDILVTGGRDAVVRVWDMRTKRQVHVLEGHKDTTFSLACQSADPQIISGSMDSTVKLWDLASGKNLTTLTNHKKGVRALAFHHSEFTFASASADNIKKWKLPEGRFVENISGHNSIVNTLSINQDNVLFSGGDNGSLRFWDWKTGHCFQQEQTIVQPGSLNAEAGVFASAFDQTGSRLFTCEADKTIKVWKEDDEATPQSHPLTNYTPKHKKKNW